MIAAISSASADTEMDEAAADTAAVTEDKAKGRVNHSGVLSVTGTVKQSPLVLCFGRSRANDRRGVRRIRLAVQIKTSVISEAPPALPFLCADRHLRSFSINELMF